MRTEKDIAEAFEIWGLLQQTEHAIARARYNELRRYVGISTAESAVMWIVKTLDGPVTPSEISRWLFRKPHTVFALLKLMQKQGLVEKVKDLERKNMVRVVLTKKGEETYKLAMERREIVPEIISSLPREERAKLRASLQMLRQKAFEQIGERTDLFPFVLREDRLLPR
jgi:DNA-binding MarR family transcriptional regulator